MQHRLRLVRSLVRWSAPGGRACFAGAVLVLLATTLPAAPLYAGVFTVGAGAGCTHSNLDDALAAAAGNGPGQDEIRLVSGGYSDLALEIATSVHIIGGFLTCTNPVSIQRTAMSGSGGVAASVIRVSGGVEVILESVQLLDGDPDPANPDQGGGLTVDGATVTMRDSTLQDNTAQRGGGALVLDGSLTLEEVEVFQNIVQDEGGGLACFSGSLSVSLEAVYFNEAQLGGGIYASDCNVDLVEASIDGNEATASGGGIFLHNGSTLTAGQDSSSAGNVSGNNGGGLFLDEGSHASLVDFALSHNVAANFGGGAVLYGASTLSMERSANCRETGRSCSEIDNNEAGWFRGGGGIAVFQGSQASVFGTKISRNRLDGPLPGLPSVALVDDPNSELVIESSMITDNRGADALFQATDGAVITLAFSTVTANQDQLHVAEALAPAGLDIFSSIVWETHGDVVAAATNGVYDCLIVHELASLPASGTIVLSDPLLQADYSLGIDSLAVDACDNFFYTPGPLDYFGQQREFDTQLPNALGPFDLGAAELQLLFLDGLESGDTSVWSATNP
jgi:hypothetical protein